MAIPRQHGLDDSPRLPGGVTGNGVNGQQGGRALDVDEPAFFLGGLRAVTCSMMWSSVVPAAASTYRRTPCFSSADSVSGVPSATESGSQVEEISVGSLSCSTSVRRSTTGDLVLVPR